MKIGESIPYIKIREEEMSNEFLTDDCHLDLDRALEEIIFLYDCYGKEDDLKLTLDAKALKNRVLDFVKKIKSL